MAKAQLRTKRRSTAWASWSLFALAFGLLGYVAYVELDAKIFQLYESRKLDQEIKAARAAPATIPVLDPTPPSTAASDVPVSLPSDDTSQPGKASGEIIGRIEIPKVSLSVIIMEGTQGKTLRRGAGHIIGTALPGQTGNVGIAGHRDSFFRPLREVRKGDEVTLTTVAATYTYKVDSISVVDPSNVSVLEDSGGSILTLVTCFPFDFVGSAPQRFIVRAHRE
jgi:sortase A